MENLRHEVESVRPFLGPRHSGALPDETPALTFRHLRDKHGPREKRFERANLYLTSHGHRLTTRTIPDPGINTTLSSTKSRKGDRHPEMRQTKKGHQW